VKLGLPSSSTDARWTNTTIRLLLIPGARLQHGDSDKTCARYRPFVWLARFRCTADSQTVCTCRLDPMSGSPLLATRHGHYTVLVKLPYIVSRFYGCKPSRAISCRQERRREIAHVAEAPRQRPMQKSEVHGQAINLIIRSCSSPASCVRYVQVAVRPGDT
jgi:hypothetical protein